MLMQIVLDVSEFQSVGQLERLLRSADDMVAAVYIKLTQGLSYSDPLADAFAACCVDHGTPHGYYDFMTNDQANAQEEAFTSRMARLKYPPRVMPMCDAEGAYNKYAQGILNWEQAYGGAAVTYADLADMPKYQGSLKTPKWVAQYDMNRYYRPSSAEIAQYKAAGYTLWQFTSNYMGLNQDASVLLNGTLADLRPAA